MHWTTSARCRTTPCCQPMTSSKAGDGESGMGIARPAPGGSRLPAPESCPVRIIGIDPGSQRTGVGSIDVDGEGKLNNVFHGALVVAGEATFQIGRASCREREAYYG